MLCKARLARQAVLTYSELLSLLMLALRRVPVVSSAQPILVAELLKAILG